MNGHVPDKQSGFVMLAVVLAITVLAAIAFALNNQGASQVNAAAGEVQRDQLRYVAEAGMSHATWQLSQNTSCSGYTDIPKTDFGADSYSATFSTNKDSPVTVTATGSLASGIEHSLINSTVRAYQPAVASVLQLGKTGGKDTLIDRFYDIQNYGVVDDLIVSSDPSWMRRSLLEFDLSAIPAGVRIISAKLELQQRIVGTPGVIGVHRVTRSWEEGTGKGTGNSDGASWLEYDGNNSWSQPGGDFASTLYATATTNSGKNGQWVAWDIRDLVDAWVSKQFPNYGLILVGDGVVDNAEFQSREEPDPASAPKLTIVFTCECGKVCAAGPGKLLLVVGDATSPVGKDLDRKSLMESWGYIVTLIDDSDSQANFDDAAATNDVIYVTASASGTAVGNKLTGSAKPIVNEPRPMIVEFGFSDTAYDSLSTDTFSTTDAAHYITKPYGGSAVTHFTSSITAPVPSGTLAPGLHSVASSGAVTNALPTLEAGAQRWDGTPVAARRVQVPFGEAEVSQLTADGLTLMRRAIEWGAGATTAGKNVLLVVNDPASLTAQETAKKALIESFGFTVNLIDESDSQANFDAAFANNDAAYIPQDINSSTLGTKLANATIGVVNEEGEQVDELGFSYDKLFKSRQEIDVIDNTHYITEQFSTGLLTVSTVNQSVHMLNGGVASGASTLGESFNTGTLWLPSLVVLETGGTLRDGGAAAGRRVQLPWGGGTFNIDLLTDDGRTIMERAIEWGAGEGPAPPAPGYFDQFNTSTCNAATDYAGSDGVVDWSPWTWTEVNELDGSCAGQIRVAPDPDIDDPGSFRLRVTGQGVRVYRTVDLTGFSQPTLSFDYRLTDYPALDFMRIRVFDGVGYNEIGRFTGPFDQTAYQSASFDLSAYAGLEIQVQFEFNGTSTTRTSYIDNVHVQEAGSGGGGGGGGGGGPAPAFESFEEYIDSNNNSASISVAKPAGTAAGDLLVAVVVTNRNNQSTLVADDAGWNLLTVDAQANSSTTGVWWKLAGSSEPASYGFSWDSGNPGRSYSWIMRFSGNDPTNPIDVWGKFGECCTNSPLAPAVTTAVDDTLILRIGGFDDDDITVGDPGMAGHTPITMQESNSGTGTVSGGAAYVEQAASGDSGTANFTLTATEQSRTITIGIAPAP